MFKLFLLATPEIFSERINVSCHIPVLLPSLHKCEFRIGESSYLRLNLFPIVMFKHVIILMKTSFISVAFVYMPSEFI